MKMRIHFLIALMSLCTVLFAQNEDDDMYFVPGKKEAKSEKAKTSKKTITLVQNDSDVYVDEEPENEPETEFYTGKLRDVDEYNRRNTVGSQLKAHVVNDTLYIITEPENEESLLANGERHGYNSDDCYYDDDFYYSSRLIRYHGRHFYDPFMWDYCYGWYDPWYDPWYGFYGPYYRYGYYSWYDWGWGWHHRPGWVWGWGWGAPIYHPHYPPHHGHKPGLGHGVGTHRFGTGRNDFVNRGNSNGIHNGNRVLPARTQGVPTISSRGLRGTQGRENNRVVVRGDQSSRESVSNRNTSNRNTTVERSTRPSTNRNSTTVNSSRSSTPSRSSSSNFGSSRSSSGGGFGGGGSRGGGGRGGR